MDENKNQPATETAEVERVENNLSAFKAANAEMFKPPVVQAVPTQSNLVETSEPDWDFTTPDKETQLDIQGVLAQLGLYVGKQNGEWGSLSIAAIEQAVDAPLTGVPSRALCVMIQKYAKDAEADGFLTQDTWGGFLMALEERTN